MEMRTLETVLGGHPFFKGLSQGYVEFIASCGKNVRFNPGELIFREGEPANHFYIVRHGKVGLEVFAPEAGPITVETLGEGEVGDAVSGLKPSVRESMFSVGKVHT